MKSKFALVMALALVALALTLGVANAQEPDYDVCLRGPCPPLLVEGAQQIGVSPGYSRYPRSPRYCPRCNAARIVANQRGVARNPFAPYRHP